MVLLLRDLCGPGVHIGVPHLCRRVLVAEPAKFVYRGTASPDRVPVRGVHQGQRRMGSSRDWPEDFVDGFLAVPAKPTLGPGRGGQHGLRGVHVFPELFPAPQEPRGLLARADVVPGHVSEIPVRDGVDRQRGPCRHRGLDDRERRLLLRREPRRANRILGLAASENQGLGPEQEDEGVAAGDF